MYIVFDLEWNQSVDGREGTEAGLPFEIIEIGAVKLDNKLNKIDEFHRIIKPAVYQRLHYKVTEVVDIGINELREKGEPFAKAARDFIDFCGEKPLFCTWGDGDLIQLERNMHYHGVELPFPFPLLYYDLQKLYGRIYYHDRHIAEPLDNAVKRLGIDIDSPFHRALDDARYTALVMQKMDLEKVKEYFSLDYYKIPKDKSEEIYLVFPDYSKYVSRAFENREDVMNDKTVTDTICFHCKRMLKKRVRWFTANQKQYHCISYCPEHGYVKSKIRLKHTDGGKIFAVKTTKLVDEETAVQYALKKQEVTKTRAEKRRKKRILKKR